MNESEKIRIDPLSVISLKLELFFEEEKLASATGFFVSKNSSNYLITNWHVITGRNPETNQPLSAHGGVPNYIQIFLHAKDKLGEFGIFKFQLYDEQNQKKWIEHTHSREIDVVALPINNIDEIQIYPLDLNLATKDIIVQIGMGVTIIGFPLGFSGGVSFPIWKTGHIASEPLLNYENKPCFLIDATTREGMSGAPVIMRANNYQTSAGDQVMQIGYEDKFLGVYSGRIHSGIEIGRVWKPNVIDEILVNV